MSSGPATGSERLLDCRPKQAAETADEPNTERLSVFRGTLTFPAPFAACVLLRFLNLILL